MASKKSTRPRSSQFHRSTKSTSKSTSPSRRATRLTTRSGNPRNLSNGKFYDTSIPNARAASQNMMQSLGGKERVIEILADSSHPKAQQLIDRLSSSAHDGENFATSYTAVGLKAIDVLDIFGQVQQAKVFINAIQEGDEVMRAVIRAAKDEIVVHEKCDGTGKVIDRKTGQPTPDDCKACYGSGYTLNSGERDAQQLYFELIGWKKQGGLVQIDARKQQATVNQVFNGQSVLAGSVPDVLQIVKRADQVLLNPMQASESKVVSGEVREDGEGMPEDVMEAETV